MATTEETTDSAFSIPNTESEVPAEQPVVELAPAATEPDQQNDISRKRTLSRLNHAIGPVAAGMVIDVVDLITFGPVGLVLGIPLGAGAGYWLGRSMRLESHMCWICAVAAGIYCTIPGTELLPLGTLVGALVRFQEEPEST